MKLYSGREAVELKEAAPQGPYHAGFVHETSSTVRDARVAIARLSGPRSEATARLLAAAPDLASSVEHHDARASAAEAALVRLKRASAALATGDNSVVGAVTPEAMRAVTIRRGMPLLEADISEGLESYGDEARVVRVSTRHGDGDHAQWVNWWCRDLARTSADISPAEVLAEAMAEDDRPNDR